MPDLWFQHILPALNLVCNCSDYSDYFLTLSESLLVPVLQHYFHCHFDCLWHWNQLERMDESRIIFSVVFLESAFLDYALSETMMAVSFPALAPLK